MAVKLVGAVLVLAGSAASAQQPGPTPGTPNWPPFRPAVREQVASAPAAGLPAVVLLPEHPTPTPVQTTSLSGSGVDTMTQQPVAGGWQPISPRPPEASVALALTPSPQTQRGSQFRGTPYIRQTRLQGLDMRGEDGQEYQIQLEVPGPDRLFRRESEQSLQMRIQQEALGRSNLDRVTFPEEPVLSTETYTARAFPPATEVVEPFYVCYGRLYFEQRNFERGGWDLGFITPFVSAGTFFCDAAWLPYMIGTHPLRQYDCNTGYCLPGDPVPFLLYPPEITVTGTVLEAGTIVALFAIFPG